MAATRVFATPSGPLIATLALVLSILVVSGTGPVAATGMVAGGEPVEPGGDAAAIAIEDGLQNDTGTVEVVLRLEDVTGLEAASLDDQATVEELEDHATESQEPIERHATDHEGVTVLETFWLANAMLLSVDTEVVDLETFEQFEDVEAIHENYAVNTPEPPSGERAEPTRDRATAEIDMIDVPAVWADLDARGEGVRVAVLDTGVEASHPDIDLYTEDPDDPTYPGGWAAFDNEGSKIEGATPNDDGTHGTHVTGTVAGGNTTGTAIGVAPEAEVIHGQVLGDDGGTFAQLLAGLEWAVVSDADVINLSLGIDGYADPLIDPIEHAEASGAIVITAIGNEGHGTSNSPGNIYDTTSVGAVDLRGEVAPFSGGETVSRADWAEPRDDWPETYTVPTITAPGVSVVSAHPLGYARSSGTSMAAPHVAGTVALLLEIDEDLTADEVDAAIYGTAWHPDGSVDDRYGHGVLNASMAAEHVAGTTEGDTPSPAVDGEPVDSEDQPHDGDDGDTVDADPENEQMDDGAGTTLEGAPASRPGSLAIPAFALAMGGSLVVLVRALRGAGSGETRR